MELLFVADAAANPVKEGRDDPNLPEPKKGRGLMAQVGGALNTNAIKDVADNMPRWNNVYSLLKKAMICVLVAAIIFLILFIVIVFK